MKQILALTVGDPTSIGPEVCEAALKELDGSIPESVDIRIFSSKTKFAKPSKESAEDALKNLSEAIEFCAKTPGATLITGPVDKYLCSLVEKSFTGQTGFLRKKTQSEMTTMLLEGPSLRVALMTEHLPLREVSQHLNTELIIKKTLQVAQYLTEVGDSRPLAILSLNPHASDGGLFGHEEKEIIQPACEALRRAGLTLDGPLPSDTAFLNSHKYSAYICMYHDQGLIPLKTRHFFEAVNISLGLPFLRVSVDHGTAFDIVGQNAASCVSYKNAIQAGLQWTKSPKPYPYSWRTGK